MKKKIFSLLGHDFQKLQNYDDSLTKMARTKNGQQLKTTEFETRMNRFAVPYSFLLKKHDTIQKFSGVIVLQIFIVMFSSVTRYSGPYAAQLKFE